MPPTIPDTVCVYSPTHGYDSVTKKQSGATSPGATDPAALYALLPSVDEVLNRDDVAPFIETAGRALAIEQLRGVLDEMRARIAGGRTTGADLERELLDLPERLACEFATDQRSSLVSVINATGVILHTNLGRAPLPAAVGERTGAMVKSYMNLEYNLSTGKRWHRDAHLERLLRDTTGCEASVVVNNNAAAVMLILNTFADGKEVIVSRGEQIEIGGSFRLPDVMEKSGAGLCEIGTTNRTRLADYRNAISDRTGMILKVHRSNFQVVGFTEETGIAELAELGRERGVPVCEDLGSGSLLDLAPFGVPDEPTVRSSVESGADLVCFSGDKLLGGPQAGIIVGRRDAIAKLRKNPLLRALRVGKLTYGALEATLQVYRLGRAGRDIPAMSMLAQDKSGIAERAKTFVHRASSSLPAMTFELTDGNSQLGGGSAPMFDIPTTLISVTHDSLSPDRLAAALRGADPAVVGRIEDDRVKLDLRTVLPEQETALLNALIHAAASPPAG